MRFVLPILMISAASIACQTSDQAAPSTLWSTPTSGADAPLVLVTVYSDFQCPYCRRVPPHLDRAVRHWPQDVQVSYRHFPLSGHTHARVAAATAQAAHKQGRFSCLHDALYDTQSRWSGASPAEFRETLDRLAASCGVDLARMRADLADRDTRALVDRDQQRGRTLGVAGTPTVFVNGRDLGRRFAPRDLIAAIRAERVASLRAIGAGTPRHQVVAARIAANNDDPRAPLWLVPAR